LEFKNNFDPKYLAVRPYAACWCDAPAGGPGVPFQIFA